MKAHILLLILLVSTLSLYAQEGEPCYFDQITNNESLWEVEEKIQAKIRERLTSVNERSSDSIRTIPVVVHIIHNGSSENISEDQVQSQIQVLNEDFGKIAGSNGDGSGVDTKVRFCLAKIDPDGNCTNGIVRVKSPLSNHNAYQRLLLKELSFWDNERYLNIYVVKSINGNVGGYSSFPGGPADEDGIVVRHNLFGNMGTASSGLGRTTSHEVGHWFGLYHTFNNGCGVDVCTDGDYVCDTPPQAAPSYNCITQNTCSNDNPDLNDLKENYMNYTPDACQSMFTNGQSERIHATLDTIRTQIWLTENLESTGCDSNYVAPEICPVIADFVTLNTDICNGNSVYFMDKSLNNPTTWKWTFEGGEPMVSTDQNPTVTYNSVGTFTVKLVVSDGVTSDSLETIGFITVSLPGTGDELTFLENFDSGLYPPTNLTINNPDGGITWELDSMASVSGDYSIKINNLINTNYGSTDELVLPFLDLTTAHPDSNVYMSYKWAYAKSNATFSDEMLVLLSADCGVNYTQIFYRTQNGLTTGPVQTTPFVPDSSQWKNAHISLNSYRNEPYVQLKIVNVTDGGNNLYIDDIYVGDGANLITGFKQSQNDIGELKLYPNPATDKTTLEFSLAQQSKISIDVYNIQGQLIRSYDRQNMADGNHKVSIATTGLEQGVYFLKIQSGITSKTIKMVVLNN